MWDLVPRPETEPRLSMLAVQSLSLWTSGEVPVWLFVTVIYFSFWLTLCLVQ